MAASQRVRWRIVRKSVVVKVRLGILGFDSLYLWLLELLLPLLAF
jgi:hypothetical protein